MNPQLDLLHPYPFEKLNALKADVAVNHDFQHIALSVGEPKHPAPKQIIELLANQKFIAQQLVSYPATKGSDALRQSCAQWLQQRFGLGDTGIDAQRQVLPVNGTREALFAFTQVVVDARKKSLVAMPNPFYQIYEGAAILAGAQPYYLPYDSNTGQIDIDAVPDNIWPKLALLNICSPHNPTGAVLELAQLKKLIDLAVQHDFIIAADECYSEIYCNDSAAPLGLLQACHQLGNLDYRNCVVFHSLSKRSNLPGLRSGFVAGDANVMSKFLQYRTYHGCSMGNHHQIASTLAWQDEQHVQENRVKYSAKFSAVIDILSPVLKVSRPAASFYLWPETPIDDLVFAKKLYQQKNLTVLPGQFLSREVNGHNPGKNHVRMALVAPLADCVDAANRIRDFVQML